VQRRHLLWCTDFAVSNESKIHSSAMLAWMDELALEHDNCRAALAWSLADPKTTSAETGLWLASALTTFWFMRDHIAEGVEWIERLLVANPVAYPDEQDVEAETSSLIVPPRPNVHGGHPRVVALLYLGVFAAFLGNTRRQASAREEALVCARRFGDGHGASQALVDLGQVARFSGDLSRALALGEEGVSLARAIGDTFGIWRSHGNFGEILLAAGNIGRARGVIEESLAAARKLGGPWELARSLWRLGTAFWQQGDLDRATALLEEAVERFAAIGVRRGAHWTVMNLGQISLQRGDLARARRWFAESLTLSQVAAEHRHLLASFEGAAATLSAVSDDESMTSSAAARMLGAAGALRAQLGQPIAPSEQKLVDQAEAGARAGLGDAAFEAARAEGAELSLDEAVDFAVMALAISPMPI
jgi:tetratricopeptide (TPR) repeat protein